MADTGAPWNIPFVEPTDLVRDYPAADEAQALAVAAGLSAAGGLVAVKSAIFTGTQTNSTAAGANFAVTDLELTHEVADAANRLIITAFIGAAGNSQGLANVGMAVQEGTDLISIGNADGVRTRMSTSVVMGAATTGNVGTHSLTIVHTPGAGSKTYTVRALNTALATQTIFINRTEVDNNIVARPRAASALVIQEVKV